MTLRSSDLQSDSDLDHSSYYSINGRRVNSSDPTRRFRQFYDWGNLNDLDSIRNSCDVLAAGSVLVCVTYKPSRKQCSLKKTLASDCSIKDQDQGHWGKDQDQDQKWQNGNCQRVAKRYRPEHVDNLWQSRQAPNWLGSGLGNNTARILIRPCPCSCL